MANKYKKQSEKTESNVASAVGTGRFGLEPFFDAPLMKDVLAHREYNS